MSVDVMSISGRKGLRFVVGVDPGLSGALALVSRRSGDLADCFDLPTTSDKKQGRRRIDAKALHEKISPLAPFIDLAIIEHVHSRPTDGVVSAFSFGRDFGTLLAVFETLGVPTTLVKPSVWKPAMGLSDDKNLSRERAAEIFPRASELFKRKKDDGRAEACLLAYQFRQLLGDS